MIVRTKELSFKYKGKDVFSDVSVSIDNPGIYGLVAPNGFGKTTFLNILSGLLQPQKGEVYLKDQKLSRKVTFQHLCFTQDSSILYDYLSAYDHLKFFCDVHNLPKEKIEETVKFLEMDSYYKKSVGTYSMGMRQRTLLAIALMSEADILLLDEPLNGLDPTSTILIREAILKVADAGRTVIVSSHNLNEIDKITNQILFIKEQKVWLEDINQYQKTTLILEFESETLKKAVELFALQEIRFEQSGNQLNVHSETVSGTDIMNVLIHNQLEIKNFQKVISGSEQRYQELYEVKAK